MAFSGLWTAVIVSGREPRPRKADLMIARVAIANRLPLHTCNPKDGSGRPSGRWHADASA